MSVSSVVFSVNNNRYPYQYEHSLLKLGTTVYVEFDGNDVPIGFYQYRKKFTKPFFVMWISTGEWFVVLEREYTIDKNYQDRLINEIENFVDRGTIAQALVIASRDIRPQHMFKSSERTNSRIAVIITVVERLELCRKLSDPIIAKQLLKHYRALVVYLLLTCFDRLGQPADWLDFGAWLKSKEKKLERDKLTPNNMHGEDSVAKIYDAYNNIYGVRNSFMKFIHSVLPAEYYDELINSIWIENASIPPIDGTNRKGSSHEKEMYLLKLRNDYTHKADFVWGIPKVIWPEGTITKDMWEMHEQVFAQTEWKTIYIKNWPECLEKIVRAGLASYVKNIVDQELKKENGSR